MKRRTVLSMEQALSLPSATLRFAQLGWRVIRIEAAPRKRPARRPEPLHRQSRRRRRPAQLFHRAQRRQGGDRAQPQGPAREAGAAATDRRARRRRVLLQHRALALPAARHRLRDAVRGEAGPDLGGHLGDGAGLSRGARLRSGDPGDVRLHGSDRRSDRPADAHGPAGDRPQGGRRSLCQRHAGAARAPRDRPRQGHSRLDAAGRGVVADHRAAADRLRLRAERDHARRQRAPQVHSDQCLSGRRRLRLPGDRQRRAMETPHRDPQVRGCRQQRARHQRRSTHRAGGDPPRHGRGDRCVTRSTRSWPICARRRSRRRASSTCARSASCRSCATS